MNEKFFDLKKEKQDRIINAALNQFSQYGYKQASTDTIVAEACISKGLLFHYFISKEGLYDFLYGYSLKYMNMELAPESAPEGESFFDTRRRIEEGRVNVMKNFPRMPLFLIRAVLDTDKTVQSIVSEASDSYDSIMERFYVKASKDGLKLPADRLIYIIDQTLNGLMEKHLRLETFRPGVYQDEALSYLQDIELVAGN